MTSDIAAAEGANVVIADLNDEAGEKVAADIGGRYAIYPRGSLSYPAGAPSVNGKVLTPGWDKVAGRHPRRLLPRITLNLQPAPIQIGNVQSYVASSSTTTTASVEDKVQQWQAAPCKKSSPNSPTAPNAACAATGRKPACSCCACCRASAWASW